MRTVTEQKSANPPVWLAQTARNTLILLVSRIGMVGPEGLEPPTKRL